MTYDGALVRLRAVEPADADAHHRWLSDPEVTRYLAWRYPIALPALRARIAAWAPPAYSDVRFSVEVRDTGELVGFVALRGLTPENRHGELDLMIGERSLWGRGYGTDATDAICRFGFEQIGLHRVELWVFAENAGAVRAYEKAGFVTEGRARDKFFKGGRWHDLLLMARLA